MIIWRRREEYSLLKCPGLQVAARRCENWRQHLSFVAPTAILLIVTAAFPARAALGGAYASVETDRVHLLAQRSSTAGPNYEVHALTSTNGGVAREFTRSDGVVFAVAWRGPGRPDLRQLLGEHFQTLQSDNVSPGGHRTHRPLSVSRSGLVVYSGGHVGGFKGYAYLPQQAPAGFSMTALH